MKITLPGQNEPIILGGTPMTPVWYEKLKYLERLQPLTDARVVTSSTGTSYTLAAGDIGTVMDFANASPVTVTVPPNSAVPFPIGTQIDAMQGGAGKVTFAPGSGVTIQSQGGNLSIAAQYVGVRLLKVATDTWRLMGSLIA